MTEYLSEDFQHKIWDAIWGDYRPYVKGNVVPFYGWYSSIGLPESFPELKYESKKMTYQGYYINSHLKFELPPEVKQGKIILSIDPNYLTQYTQDIDMDPGFVLYAPNNGFILNEDENGEDLKSSGIKLTKMDIQLNESVELELFHSKRKKLNPKNRNFFFLRPSCFNPWTGFQPKSPWKGDKPIDYSNDIEKFSTGWYALDAQKVDDYTLKIFSTSLFGRVPDFTSFVFTIQFPATLEECKVGFIDKPDYFRTNK